MKRSLVPPAGREPFKPRNPEQLAYLKAIQTNEQVIVTGKAGTGKTYIPSAHAANLLLMDNGIDRFIISRPAVGVGGEKHGFLPGKLDMKVAPWVIPIMDVLEERLGQENVKRLWTSGDFAVMDFEHMRGRTVKNSFILLDEAQNTTVEQMKCFLTRPGEGSRVVITGDLSQSDLRTDNGLSYAVYVAQKQKLPVTIHHLTKVERSGICGIWADAFEKEDQPAFLRAA